MSEPLVWQDEVFSDGTPDPAPPVSLPATAEEAKKQLDAIYAPGSTFNWNAPGALDFALGLAHKSAAASADTRSPVGGSVTSELPPPEATATETARQARIEAIQGDPLFKAGDHALTIELADLLNGGDVQIPTTPTLEPELPPVELPEALPAFTLPAHLAVAPDDPAIQHLRDVAAYAELPAATMQNAITRVLDLVTKTDPIEDADAIAALDAKATAAAKAKYGTRFAAMVEDAHQGRTILVTENEDLHTLLADPRVKSDPLIFEALAELGKRARTYYVRRHGTGGRQVVRW